MSMKQSMLDHVWVGSYGSYLLYLETQAKIDCAPPEAELQARSYYTDEDEDGIDERYQGYEYMIETFGSLASINIDGPLVATSNWMTQMFGMTGYDEIQNAVSAAAMEPGIDNILLDINSPGGSVSGLAEAGSIIRKVDSNVMPVSAFSSGSMTSAAYWLGSSAREIHATDMASIGGVGVIAVHMERSEMLKKEGIKPTVFTAGKYKGIGNPYEPLSESDKEYIQAIVNRSYEFFVSAVADNRGLTESYVRDNIANGKDFFAEEAKSLGLIDRINSFQDVVSLLDSGHNPQHSSTL